MAIANETTFFFLTGYETSGTIQKYIYIFFFRNRGGQKHKIKKKEVCVYVCCYHDQKGGREKRERGEGKRGI